MLYTLRTGDDDKLAQFEATLLLHTILFLLVTLGLSEENVVDKNMDGSMDRLKTTRCD